MTAQRGKQRMLRMPCLDERPGIQGPVSACAAGHLHQRGEQPFRSAEIGGEKARIGIHHDHQRQPVEIVPLGQHLCAHQQVGTARMYILQKGLRRALVAGHVAVQPADVGMREQRAQRIFQLLGAPAQGGQILVAAGGAGTRHGLGGGAVMTHQPVASGRLLCRRTGGRREPVQDAVGVAAVAA